MCVRLYDVCRYVCVGSDQKRNIIFCRCTNNNNNNDNGRPEAPEIVIYTMCCMKFYYYASISQNDHALIYLI